jgi:hypothetical protein
LNETLIIISIVLNVIVGAVCLFMALKQILAKEYLPFHAEAAAKPWKELDSKLQEVILTMMRISGLGFLITALLLLVFPVFNYWERNLFIQYSAPILASIFCLGLFILNFKMYKKTHAKTPWQASIIALCVLLVSIALSSI